MNKQNHKSNTDLLCEGYGIRFNEVDRNGRMFTKDSINIENFIQMKLCGTIVDYEIDDNGVKIIKKFDLTGVSL